MEKGWLIGFGVFFLVIAFIAYQIPLDVTLAGTPHSITIPHGVALCDARIGQFAEMAPDVARFCSEYKTAFMGIYLSGFLGVVLIIIASVINGKRKEI
jgi:hypothetical protein